MGKLSALQTGLRVGIARCDSKLASHCAGELHKDSMGREWLKRHFPLIICENCYYRLYDFFMATHEMLESRVVSQKLAVDLAHAPKMKDPVAIALSRVLVNAAPLSYNSTLEILKDRSHLSDREQELFERLWLMFQQPYLTSNKEILFATMLVLKDRGLPDDLPVLTDHKTHRGLNRLPWYVYGSDTTIGARALHIAANHIKVPVFSLDVLLGILEWNRIPIKKMTLENAEETKNPYASIWWIPVQRQLLKHLFPKPKPMEIVKRWNEEWSGLIRQEVESMLRSQ